MKIKILNWNGGLWESVYWRLTWDEEKAYRDGCDANLATIGLCRTDEKGYNKIFKVVNKQLFFIAVMTHGIEYKEVGFHIMDRSVVDKEN